MGQNTQTNSHMICTHKQGKLYYALLLFHGGGLKILLYLLMNSLQGHTVKTLKIGTPEIITIIVLQLEQLDFTVQYCDLKMQTE